jgi:hypothetical protein
MTECETKYSVPVDLDLFCLGRDQASESPRDGSRLAISSASTSRESDSTSIGLPVNEPPPSIDELSPLSIVYSPHGAIVPILFSAAHRPSATDSFLRPSSSPTPILHLFLLFIFHQSSYLTSLQHLRLIFTVPITLQRPLSISQEFENFIFLDKSTNQHRHNGTGFPTR